MHVKEVGRIWKKKAKLMSHMEYFLPVSMSNALSFCIVGIGYIYLKSKIAQIIELIQNRDLNRVVMFCVF